jgi:exosortase
MPSVVDHSLSSSVGSYDRDNSQVLRPLPHDGLWLIVLAGVLFALCFFATGEAFGDMWAIATTDPESSHVLLVPLVVAWLVWTRRRKFTLDTNRRGFGVLFLVFGWGLWTAGYRWQIQSFWHGGAVVMLAGCMLVAMGNSALKAFWPAFLALVFLVPVPDTGRQLFALPLQRITASVTQSVAEMLGMEVQRHANLLTVNGFDIAVVEACNGMRMVFSLFLACYVFAFVTPLRMSVRVLILLASPVIAVVSNVIRLVPTIWMFGHVSRGAADKFHDASGWAMLIVAFLGLCGIVGILRWAGVEVDGRRPGGKTP